MCTLLANSRRPAVTTTRTTDFCLSLEHDFCCLAQRMASNTVNRDSSDGGRSNGDAVAANPPNEIPVAQRQQQNQNSPSGHPLPSPHLPPFVPPPAPPSALLPSRFSPARFNHTNGISPLLPNPYHGSVIHPINASTHSLLIQQSPIALPNSQLVNLPHFQQQILAQNVSIANQMSHPGPFGLVNNVGVLPNMNIFQFVPYLNPCFIGLMPYPPYSYNPISFTDLQQQLLPNYYTQQQVTSTIETGPPVAIEPTSNQQTLAPNAATNNDQQTVPLQIAEIGPPLAIEPTPNQQTLAPSAAINNGQQPVPSQTTKSGRPVAIEPTSNQQTSAPNAAINNGQLAFASSNVLVPGTSGQQRKRALNNELLRTTPKGTEPITSSVLPQKSTKMTITLKMPRGGVFATGASRQPRIQPPDLQTSLLPTGSQQRATATSGNCRTSAMNSSNTKPTASNNAFAIQRNPAFGPVHSRPIHSSASHHTVPLTNASGMQTSNAQIRNVPVSSQQKATSTGFNRLAKSSDQSKNRSPKPKQAATSSAFSMQQSNVPRHVQSRLINSSGSKPNVAMFELPRNQTLVGQRVMTFPTGNQREKPAKSGNSQISLYHQPNCMPPKTKPTAASTASANQQQTNAIDTVPRIITNPSTSQHSVLIAALLRQRRNQDLDGPSAITLPAHSQQQGPTPAGGNQQTRVHDQPRNVSSRTKPTSSCQPIAISTASTNPNNTTLGTFRNFTIDPRGSKYNVSMSSSQRRKEISDGQHAFTYQQIASTASHRCQIQVSVQPTAVSNNNPSMKPNSGRIFDGTTNDEGLTTISSSGLRETLSIEQSPANRETAIANPMVQVCQFPNENSQSPSNNSHIRSNATKRHLQTHRNYSSERLSTVSSSSASLAGDDLGQLAIGTETSRGNVKRRTATIIRTDIDPTVHNVYNQRLQSSPSRKSDPDYIPTESDFATSEDDEPYADKGLRIIFNEDGTLKDERLIGRKASTRKSPVASTSKAYLTSRKIARPKAVGPSTSFSAMANPSLVLPAQLNGTENVPNSSVAFTNRFSISSSTIQRRPGTLMQRTELTTGTASASTTSNLTSLNRSEAGHIINIPSDSQLLEAPCFQQQPAQSALSVSLSRGSIKERTCSGHKLVPYPFSSESENSDNDEESSYVEMPHFGQKLVGKSGQSKKPQSAKLSLSKQASRAVKQELSEHSIKTLVSKNLENEVDTAQLSVKSETEKTVEKALSNSNLQTNSSVSLLQESGHQGNTCSDPALLDQNLDNRDDGSNNKSGSALPFSNNEHAALIKNNKDETNKNGLQSKAVKAGKEQCAQKKNIESGIALVESNHESLNLESIVTGAHNCAHEPKSHKVGVHCPYDGHLKTIDSSDRTSSIYCTNWGSECIQKHVQQQMPRLRNVQHPVVVLENRVLGSVYNDPFVERSFQSYDELVNYIESAPHYQISYSSSSSSITNEQATSTASTNISETRSGSKPSSCQKRSTRESSSVDSRSKKFKKAIKQSDKPPREPTEYEQLRRDPSQGHPTASVMASIISQHYSVIAEENCRRKNKGKLPLDILIPLDQTQTSQTSGSTTSTSINQPDRQPSHRPLVTNNDADHSIGQNRMYEVAEPPRQTTSPLQPAVSGSILRNIPALSPSSATESDVANGVQELNQIRTKY